jgi:hypothetical protein
VYQKEVGEAEMWLSRTDSLLPRLENRRNAVNIWQSMQCTRGRLYLAQQHFEQAEQALLTCRGENVSDVQLPSFVDSETAGILSSTEQSFLVSGQSAFDLVCLYDAWGRPSQADRFRQEAIQHQQRIDAEKADYTRWMNSKGR